MAAYTVAEGKVGAHAKTLVADTADSVTFADDLPAVEVVSDGAAALYFTTDDSTPTVGGPNTHLLPAAVSRRTVKVAGAGDTVVKLISAGTPTYSVARAVA